MKKNLQIIYKSTASDTSNTAKKSQKLICVGGYNITFFVIFAVLDVSLAVNLWINCSFFTIICN